MNNVWTISQITYLINIIKEISFDLIDDQLICIVFYNYPPQLSSKQVLNQLQVCLWLIIFGFQFCFTTEIDKLNLRKMKCSFVTNMGQRKNLSPQQEMNPSPRGTSSNHWQAGLFIRLICDVLYIYILLGSAMLKASMCYK